MESAYKKIQGLTEKEAEDKAKKGLSNHIEQKSQRSYRQIVSSNLMTLFNLINLILACAVLWTGVYKNALFMGVVFCNLLIGIVQEIRAKRAVDRLSFLIREKVKVIRNGKERWIEKEELVQGDTIFLKAGAQVPCDCILIQGICEADESILTGESDTEQKQQGDRLLAGSFLVSGTIYAKCEKVGKETYLYRLSDEAKKYATVKSQIMHSLKKLIRIVSILIFPLGLLLFLNQYLANHATLTDSILATTGALIGMIPEGLMLLTSTVMAVGVIFLGKKNVLAQELYCLESLARVDTLCLDKTGTLTQGSLKWDSYVPLERTPNEEIEKMLCALSHASEDQNATMQALTEKWAKNPSPYSCIARLPFNSARKLSAFSFEGIGTFYLGAPEFLLKNPSPSFLETVQKESSLHRVLLLAFDQSILPQDINTFVVPSTLKPVALLLLKDQIRMQASQTLNYFYEQGVDCRIISGDNLQTVQLVARQVGFHDWEKGIDVSSLQNEEDLEKAALRYKIFARVTPHQKQRILSALQKKGHVVAMTGDGVNDVMALKQADCSIAMASGSEAARRISHLVLMESNFDGLPSAVQEGRKCINNIQRSASLYLVKTIFSILLSLAFLFLSYSYPFVPIQLTLIGSLGIGIPSLLLGLGPNKERVKGSFLKNILIRALPAGLAISLGLLFLLFLASKTILHPTQISTCAFLYTSIIIFVNLFIVCLPLNGLRILMQICLWVSYVIALCFFSSFFMLSFPTLQGCLTILFPSLLSGFLLYALIYFLLQKIGKQACTKIKRQEKN